MLIIGEKVNVMMKAIGAAIKDRDKKPIQEMALLQAEGGASWLDINLGPATKEGPEKMRFVVESVQEVTDLPLALDTMNIDAMKAGLEVVKGEVMINSISSGPERIEKLMPMAVEHNAWVVGLTLNAQGNVPRDADERVEVAYNILMAAQEYGIPMEKILIDPIVLPISVTQDQVHALVDAMDMLQGVFAEFDPAPGTVVGLSNVSNGVPDESLCSLINRTLLAVLMAKGLTAAIVDPNDEELMGIIGKNEEYQIVEKIVKGEAVDESDPLTIKLLKTWRVLTEETLYAHSYLEL
ncbi:MAG: dihydropteroate synthase [Actinomycetota bacterium]|nr:dihydropteroate synthase [Actinomycetota bacterium]MDD5666756.1 dihydropteroate synthase [Actinomycetota bacterium]